MSRTRPDLVLDAGIDHEALHKPIHEPGFAAYCPVCGIGCESAAEATTCCEVLAPAKERRIRTRYER